MISIPIETLEDLCKKDIDLTLNMKEDKAICIYSNTYALVNLMYIPFKVEETKKLKYRFIYSNYWKRLIASNYVVRLFDKYHPDTNEQVWERIIDNLCE